MDGPVARPELKEEDHHGSSHQQQHRGAQRLPQPVGHRRADGKSLEKLSSGFRINRAADDAAGLSISEGLRSQIGGLKVAVRNAQDGVSVVQTADGALTEIHSILQRMRDLAVQAANSGSQDDGRAVRC